MFSFAPGDYAGFPGRGLLRLHSTFRHDLKIYASDEGRVQMTAAAFAKVSPLVLPMPPLPLGRETESGGLDEKGSRAAVLIQRHLCPKGLGTVGVGHFRLSLHPRSGMSTRKRS